MSGSCCGKVGIRKACSSFQAASLLCFLLKAYSLGPGFTVYLVTVASGDDSWLGLDCSSSGGASWGISVEGDFSAVLERFPLPFFFLTILISPQIFQLKTSKNKSQSHLQNCSSQEKYTEELLLSLLLIKHNSSKFAILYKISKVAEIS